MKGLFLVYHGFSDFSGISKKIFAQCEALRRCGVEMELCYTTLEADGTQRRMVGNRVLRDFGRGLRAKLLKRFSFGDLVRHVRERQIDFVYIRHDFNSSPVLCRLLRRLRRAGARIVLEIPTWPYDQEFIGVSRYYQVRIRIDRLFRRRMMRSVDRIVTFTDDPEILGRPTLRISNGVDFGSIVCKGERRDTGSEVRLLAVANIHFWHGIDRAIEGIARYKASNPARRVLLRIVGDGDAAVIADLRRRIDENGLEEWVRIEGTRSGEALDAEFDWCDMGIASLGRHRSGITRIKTLKNREYAARGIPFVYSEEDSDFDTQPYVMKAPADESPLDIAALLRFYDSVPLTPAEIRASVEASLSWEAQMRRVLAEGVGAAPETKA